MTDIDKLVEQYADADESDTFASYNSAILLAREVLRVRASLAVAVKALEQYADSSYSGGPARAALAEIGSSK